MSYLNLNLKPKPSKDVVFHAIPPETVLLNLETGYYYSTNRIGTEVWRRCDGETAISAIIEGLHNQFNVDIDRLSADILAFLEQMVAEGLLKADGHE